MEVELRKQATQIQKILLVPSRVAFAMASSPCLQNENLQKCFMDGRLPCSFSLQLLWEPVIAQLEHFGQKVAAKESAIIRLQQKRNESFRNACSAKQHIQELSDRLMAFEEEEHRCEEEEEILKKELEELEEMDIISLLPFVRSAAKVEKQLVFELEDKLSKDRDGLFALHEEGSPKLSLLMNCFGAEKRTIKQLQDLNSKNFISHNMAEVNLLVSALPRVQQTVVRYTQERLKSGKLPFADHDCALCDCETPEEMANFLSEHGLKQVTADIVRKAGAYGRGALLFLTSQNLQLGNGQAEKRALRQSRASHIEK